MSLSYLELVQELSSKLNASISEVGGNFLMKIPMSETEHQDVMVITIENGQKEKILKFFSIAGPIEKNEELMHFLLKNNLGMDYGSFSLMILNDQENLVVVDSCLLHLATVEETLAAVQYITKVSYDARKRLSSGLNPL